MSNMSLRAKIVMLVLAALAGMAIITAFSVVAVKRDLTDGRKEVIKSVVEGGYNLLVYYHEMEKSGKLTREEAQKQAAEAIGAARYGGPDSKTEYLYIWTMKGVSVMHVNRSLIGQDMLEKIKDGQGRYTIKDIIASLQSQKGAYVDTSFPRPGSKEPVDKLQYVMKF